MHAVRATSLYEHDSNDSISNCDSTQIVYILTRLGTCSHNCKPINDHCIPLDWIRS